MPGVGGTTPPLPPATNAAPATGGGATAPAAPAATTGAVAGAAGAGAAALGGGDSGSLAAVIQQLVTTLQSVVAALGGGSAPVSGGGATAAPAGPNRAFANAALKPFPLNLPAPADGAALIGQMEQAVAARRGRVAELSSALQQDAATSGFTNQLDAQQLQWEKELNEHYEGLLAKLKPAASTIDAAEAGQVMQLLVDANSKGHMDTGKLASIIMQIEGSAKGLSPDQIARGQRAAETVGRFNTELYARQEQMVKTQAATGQVNQLELQKYNDDNAKMDKISMALRAIFEATGRVADVPTELDQLAAARTIDEAFASVNGPGL